MSKKVLIIGSARGIGLGLVQKYKSQGFQVIGTCRKATEELKKEQVSFCENIELTDKDAHTKIKTYLLE